MDQRADILLLHLILFMLLCHLQNQKLHEGHQYDSTGINVLLLVKKWSLILYILVAKRMKVDFKLKPFVKFVLEKPFVISDYLEIMEAWRVYEEI